MVSHVTLIGLVSPGTEIVSGSDVTIYSVIALPPVFAGGINSIIASPSHAVATTSVGASGGVCTRVGVTGSDAALGDERPAALSALTVNVYAIPLVSHGKVTLGVGDDMTIFHG